MFKKLLEQLAIPDQGFIDKNSKNNWENIYVTHFTDDYSDCSRENKINWIKSIPSLKCFYNLFFCKFFIGKEGYSGFFEAHFLHKGKNIISDKVDARHPCTERVKKKLNDIFQALKSFDM